MENFLSSLIDFPVPWSSSNIFQRVPSARTIAAFIYPSYCAKSLQLSNFAKLCHCYSNLSSEQYYCHAIYIINNNISLFLPSSPIPILIHRHPEATKYQYPDLDDLTNREYQMIIDQDTNGYKAHRNSWLCSGTKENLKKGENCFFKKLKFQI